MFPTQADFSTCYEVRLNLCYHLGNMGVAFEGFVQVTI